AAHAVEAGVDDDAVQPGGDGRLAAEGPGLAVGGDEGVLDGVGGLVGVAERAQRDGPHPVTVPLDDLAERMRIPVDVRGQQLGVADRGPIRWWRGLGWGVHKRDSWLCRSWRVHHYFIDGAMKLPRVCRKT